MPGCCAVGSAPALDIQSDAKGMVRSKLKDAVRNVAGPVGIAVNVVGKTQEVAQLQGLTAGQHRHQHAQLVVGVSAVSLSTVAERFISLMMKSRMGCGLDVTMVHTLRRRMFSMAPAFTASLA